MSSVKYALEMVTGKKVSDYALLHEGTFIELVKSLSDKSLPFHFNDIKERTEEEELDLRNELRAGYLVVTEKDTILFDEGLYKGMKKIYTPRQIKKLLEENVILVK